MQLYVRNIAPKTNYRWMGPYRLRSIGKFDQVYLSELDVSKLRDPVMRNRAKGCLPWMMSLQIREDQQGLDNVVLKDEDPWGSSSCRVVFEELLYLVKGIQ